MKNKIVLLFVITLVIITLTSCNASRNDENITQTPTLEVNTTEELAEYRTYYDILSAAVNGYGLGAVEQNSIPNLYSGVIHAELIDFNNDGLPELLYAYNDGSDKFWVHFAVYGFGSGKAELLDTYTVAPTHLGVNIALNQDGLAYLHYLEINAFNKSDSYYTLIDGEWTSVLELYLSTEDVEDAVVDWFVNGNEVDELEYDSSLKALGIVSSRELWWGNHGVDLDTVQMLLSELKTRSKI